MTLLAVLLGVLAVDPLPYFRPDPRPVYGPALPDPDVPECAANDRACIDAHDELAEAMAIASGNRDGCASSTRPLECEAVFDMVAGDVEVKRPVILDDPCAWVVQVDRGIATIASRKLGVTKRLADRGWKPRTFVGACDLATYRATFPEMAIPLPQWTPPPATKKILPAQYTTNQKGIRQ